MPKGQGGGGGKRLVSFMNFIVDKIIFLLSELFMVGSPYKYSCIWLSKLFLLAWSKISFTLDIRVSL